MVALLTPAEQQFCDQNGAPYAGGSIAFYVPGTTTPKNTWKDSGGTVLNTNPVILDAAGRAVIYGDGIYRMQLYDQFFNLIYDQLSSTLVSAAMAPVCLAADLPTAKGLLGIVDNSAALASLTSGAAAEITNRNAAIAVETTRATTAEGTLNTAINTERTRALAAEAALAGTAGFPAGQRFQFGSGTTNSSGLATVAFPINFSAVPVVLIGQTGGPSASPVVSYGVSISGFSAYSAKSFTTGNGLGPASFVWLAMGAL